MPREVLAIENIESKSKDIKKEEVDAINIINDFLGKNKGDDEVMKQLKGDVPETPEDIKAVKEAYNLVKDRVKFSDAYSYEEYESCKKDIVFYLKNNMGKGYNEASEMSLYKIDPVMMQVKLFEYNTSKNGIEKPINIAKFMTNFEAERIRARGFVIKYERSQEIKNENKNHKTGKILDLSDTEKQGIKDKVDIVINDADVDLRILGQANGVKPKTREGIEKTYTDLRTEVLKGCDPKVQQELLKIFPDFDQKNFPDQEAWNMGYAMSRALNILSALDTDQKNKLFSSQGGNANVFKKDSKNASASLGKVKFIFKAVEETGDEYTLGDLEVVPTKMKIVKTLSNNVNAVIKQLNSTSITFEIDYNGKDKYVGGSYVNKYVGKTMRAYEFINTAIDTGQKRLEDVFVADATPPSENVVDITQYHKNMNILIPYSDIAKYPEFIKQDSQGKIYTKAMSFKDALNFYKTVNKDNLKAIEYAKVTEDMLENFEYLNAYINNNPDIKNALAVSLLPNYTGDQTTMISMFLKNLGVTFLGGKKVKIGNMVYEGGKIYRYTE